MKQACRLALIAMSLLLMVACQSQRSQTPETLQYERQPRTGGMVLPQATSEQPATPVPALAPTGQSLLQAGQEVAAVGVDFFRLYADADPKAPVLNVYSAGESFIVIEPGGTITTYPVVKDGRTWYRVRTADGLVGWVLIDAVVPTDAE